MQLVSGFSYLISLYKLLRVVLVQNANLIKYGVCGHFCGVRPWDRKKFFYHCIGKSNPDFSISARRGRPRLVFTCEYQLFRIANRYMLVTVCGRGCDLNNWFVFMSEKHIVNNEQIKTDVEWMNLENTILGERIQSQNTIHCKNLFMRISKIRKSK